MKKYVINLARRPERKTNFLKNNPLIGHVNWFTAADGNELSYNQVMELGFVTPDYWREPFRNRRLLKGEVGCFISHFMLWRMCAAGNEPVMIMEDDCILSDDWNDFLADPFMIDDDSQRKYDLFFVGYSENDKATLLNDPKQLYVQPKYPYNAHCYILYPTAARRLVASALQATGKYVITPADEHIAQQVLKSPETVMAYASPRAWQVSRQEQVSDIEPGSDSDYFVDRNTIAYTVGTDRQKMRMLNDSAAKYGVYPLNLGNNEEWKGGNMDFPGGMHKLHLLYEQLEDLNPRDIVLFTDAYDVFYADDLKTITERYLAMGSRVVFSAEATCWPDADVAEQYPPSDTKYRFLNSGTFIGEVQELKNILTPALALPPNEDDQRFLTRQFLSGNFDIRLDTDQYIFVVGETNVFKFGPHGQLCNRETNSTSCIYHGAGGPETKAFVENLYKQFAPPTDFAYIPEISRNLIHLDRDMLLIDFMTQSQCEQLIERSEEYGNWESLSYDKFPAQEIRVKELKLWDMIAKRWTDYINPIVEQYWHPLQMYGLRDAFTMRYSVDTQKSLNLHHDASLVTGSVKLNEDYMGADLIFPRQNVSNKDVPVGMCILFPGQVTHGHECTELISGVKYSLTMWTSRLKGDIL